MTISVLSSQNSHSRPGIRCGGEDVRRMNLLLRMGVQPATLLLLLAFGLTTLSARVRAQSLASSTNSSGGTENTTQVIPDLTYTPPTSSAKLVSYSFDAYGPYPITGAAFAAGISQMTNSPPEWNQGMAGYGKRFGSSFGIAVVGTTTRFGLAAAFKEDTLYYRCECSGVFPRLRHAAISTFTGRHGEDGHRVFSIPAIVAPYAGSTVAVYGWYPSRFGAKDAFRMGNYSLLAYFGENVALEFIYRGPHSLFSKMHLNNRHGSTVQGPNK